MRGVGWCKETLGHTVPELVPRQWKHSLLPLTFAYCSDADTCTLEAHMRALLAKHQLARLSPSKNHSPPTPNIRARS